MNPDGSTLRQNRSFCWAKSELLIGEQLSIMIFLPTIGFPIAVYKSRYFLSMYCVHIVYPDISAVYPVIHIITPVDHPSMWETHL